MAALICRLLLHLLSARPSVGRGTPLLLWLLHLLLLQLLLLLEVVHGLDVFLDPPDLVLRSVIHEPWLVNLMPDAHRNCEFQLAVSQVMRSRLCLRLVGVKTCFDVVTLILLQAYDVQALGLPHDLDFLFQRTTASLLDPRIADDLQGLSNVRSLWLCSIHVGLPVFMGSAATVFDSRIL